MTPKIKDFPYCCTAAILYNFGESYAAAGGGYEPDAKAFEKTILEEIKTHKVYGYAMITAITNSQQKCANKVLRRLGFKSSRWMSKTAHQDTKIKLWYKQLGEDT